jgi:hypothetical protein
MAQFGIPISMKEGENRYRGYLANQTHKDRHLCGDIWYKIASIWSELYSNHISSKDVSVNDWSGQIYDVVPQNHHGSEKFLLWYHYIIMS